MLSSAGVNLSWELDGGKGVDIINTNIQPFFLNNNIHEIQFKQSCS